MKLGWGYWNVEIGMRKSECGSWKGEGGMRSLEGGRWSDKAESVVHGAEYR